MHVAVGIVAGTAIRGAAANVMMRPVLERHPNAFLITLANFGVSLPLLRSQTHLEADIARALEKQNRPTDTPIVLVGHSQGGLAVLRYAVDHPDQVVHVVSVGSPWHGAVSAGTVSRLVGGRLLGGRLTPALRDMTRGSDFLTALHSDLPQIADRVTNIYSTHELFIRPYVDAHVDVEGVSNILIATEEEHLRHLRMYPEHPLDDIIVGRVNHLSEMHSPEVRQKIWAKVNELNARLGRWGVPGNWRDSQDAALE